MTMKNDTKIEEELTCHFKIYMRNFMNFDPSPGKSPKFALWMGSFWPRYIMFELKKYRGVIFHGNEEWWNISRKTDLWFEKWNEKFGKFSPDHSKMSKLELWLGLFVQGRKCMSLKFTEELGVMTMKNDRWGIWRILSRALEKLKNLFFNWLLWAICLSWKKNRRVMFDGNEEWCKISRKTDLCF